ncbi:acetoin utilization protein AcuC [Arenibacterium sp. CAU 1754]
MPLSDRPAPTDNTAPVFLGNDIYRASTYGATHPLAIQRVPTVTDLCRAMGWLPDAAYRTSPRLKPAGLRAFHTAEYIAALMAAEASQSVTDAVRARHNIGTLSNPVYPAMFRRPATSAGGAMLAADLLRNGGVVYHPAGGTHHGMPDRANGFCYFNDPVLAILTLQRGGVRRVAYVDIDAHHCDGVEMAFDGAPEVRMISLHEENRWPFTGALDDRAGGSAFNLPLPRALNDSEYALTLDQIILPAVADHRPDAIVLQCGADAVAEDPLSRLTLSNSCHWATVAALRSMSHRFLVLGGGGYNPWSVGRLWSGVWATLAGHEIPDRLPDAAQSVLRALSWTRRAGRTPPEHWFTTLRDAPNTGPIRADVRDRVAHLAARLTREV